MRYKFHFSLIIKKNIKIIIFGTLVWINGNMKRLQRVIFLTENFNKIEI